MILDNPPNQIAWRGALLSGKHLELLEHQIREFHGSPHNYHCPMPGNPYRFPRHPAHNDKMDRPTNMERASKLIRGLRLPGGTLSGEELACAVWPQAVGEKIAAHTRAARMVRTRLVVEVEDVTWQRQLNALSRRIVWNLEQTLGKGLVEDLEFRVVPRRREPQRAAAAVPALFADDSDAIADPVMRSIYRASRKKALA